MQASKIAFFGLGTMGTGMARRLLNAGYDLTIYNRNPARAESLGGGTIANSPAKAAEGRDILIAMLADDPASRAVWLGDATTPGALSTAKKGAIALDCSTLTVACVRELAEAIHRSDDPRPYTRGNPRCAVYFLSTWSIFRPRSQQPLGGSPAGERHAALSGNPGAGRADWIICGEIDGIGPEPTPPPEGRTLWSRMTISS